MNTQANEVQEQVSEATAYKLYASREEVEANKPADATKNHKVFEVSKNAAVVGRLGAATTTLSLVRPGWPATRCRGVPRCRR